MYIPKYYIEKDQEAIREFLKANGFGILVSLASGRLWATHLPMLFETNEKNQDILTGHLSRANVQWKEFTDNPDVLAIFQGPNAYVSSSWYDHENVPTWNYIAVHVYGKVRIIEGKELMAKLGCMVNKYETGMDQPVSLERMSAEFVQKEIHGIVGFEIQITEIQAASKLSQNRDLANFNGIIRGLEKKGDTDSCQIASLMKGRK
jgi:transcriptional regulator